LQAHCVDCAVAADRIKARVDQVLDLRFEQSRIGRVCSSVSPAGSGICQSSTIVGTSGQAPPQPSVSRIGSIYVRPDRGGGFFAGGLGADVVGARSALSSGRPSFQRPLHNRLALLDEPADEACEVVVVRR
jgi:hypothetical protein